MQNFYTYTTEKNQKLYGYRRKYKKHILRKRGFFSKGDAESDLRDAMSNIDAERRGEVRACLTTVQDALDIYKRKLKVRAKDKAYQYGHAVAFTSKMLQEFVDRFGSMRLVREITETDLREFYQTLCFRPGVSKNSAGSYIGSLQGMLKAAQETRPDLVNWLRPKLKLERRTENERRTVEPDEYAALVSSLLNPPAQVKPGSLWRDAADLVQLLRLTGGRLNEVLRMTLDQVIWSKGIVRLYASKTESTRDVPLSNGIRKVVQTRIREGLTVDGLIFPRAEAPAFDKRISRTVRQAAARARLDYGITSGFTLHSFRHTFITDLMEKTGNDVGIVMSYSGHKSLESFSAYLHATGPGRELAIQALNSVVPIVTPFDVPSVPQGQEGQLPSDVKPLMTKQVAAS